MEPCPRIARVQERLFEGEESILHLIERIVGGRWASRSGRRRDGSASHGRRIGRRGLRAVAELGVLPPNLRAVQLAADVPFRVDHEVAGVVECDGGLDAVPP
jgi:hypothetical protein